MSKLNIDQKTIKDLFGSKHTDFLIPDYQRPYAWGDDECQTLWEDIFAFAIPENDYSKFRQDDEYFLGPIVTFKNESDKQEIIDGQQRLTTLMLMLRAFYAKFGSMKDDNSLKTRQMIESCIWKTDEFGRPDKDKLKIDSEVATDDDKAEFLTLLKEGKTEKNQKSNYARNYRFFENKISEFLQKYPTYFPYLPIRLLNNCILLPIEAESQDTALRIFSTLNDRGLPLSDADIFKAQFYKHYSATGRKDQFIFRWKKLEDLCSTIFSTSGSGSCMDEIFTRYMYYLRASQGITRSTTEALRKFYEKDNYAILKQEKTFNDLEILADFWYNVSIQNEEIFSERVLSRLFVLNFAPNGMWSYLVSVYFMSNKEEDTAGNWVLEEDKFYKFLNITTAFIWAYALTNPGVNALRTPVYAEMVKIVKGQNAQFDKFKFDEQKYRDLYANYNFFNQRPLTKSMIAWKMMQTEGQPVPKLETLFEIEHIYPRNRFEKEETLKDKRTLEMLGNKAMLEKKINIRASDYRFADKKKYYEGYTNSKNEYRPGTINRELTLIAQKVNDFDEQAIKDRNKEILDEFINYLRNWNLLA